MSNEWNNSVWSCCSPFKACCLSCCCTCLIYGQQSERMEDPALKEGSYVNGDCCLFTLASFCSLHWVLLMMKRRDMREKFGIKGSVGKDCLLSCCCTCCVLVQHDKELDTQAARFQTPVGYQAPSAMAYSQQESKPTEPAYSPQPQ
ncbi:PLAC8 family protein [Aspergillus undulatus]|uniref:PLAC8 family protein n=1 Tax=Aspergillus undulatus TaxID=1810928 RepID=UPI003CCDF5DB